MRIPLIHLSSSKYDISGKIILLRSSTCSIKKNGHADFPASNSLHSFTFLFLFCEQKENCKLIHHGLAFLSTSSLVLIDCSGTPLSTKEGFVCTKEMIQEGRKLFFDYLTICCVEILSCVNSW